MDNLHTCYCYFIYYCYKIIYAIKIPLVTFYYYYCIKISKLNFIKNKFNECSYLILNLIIYRYHLTCKVEANECTSGVIDYIFPKFKRILPNLINSFKYLIIDINLNWQIYFDLRTLTI